MDLNGVIGVGRAGGRARRFAESRGCQNEHVVIFCEAKQKGPGWLLRALKT
jgi:hypothetical protein